MSKEGICVTNPKKPVESFPPASPSILPPTPQPESKLKASAASAKEFIPGSFSVSALTANVRRDQQRPRRGADTTPKDTGNNDGSAGDRSKNAAGKNDTRAAPQTSLVDAKTPRAQQNNPRNGKNETQNAQKGKASKDKDTVQPKDQVKDVKDKDAKENPADKKTGADAAAPATKDKNKPKKEDKAKANAPSTAPTTAPTSTASADSAPSNKKKGKDSPVDAPTAKSASRPATAAAASAAAATTVAASEDTETKEARERRVEFGTVTLETAAPRKGRGKKEKSQPQTPNPAPATTPAASEPSTPAPIDPLAVLAPVRSLIPAYTAPTARPAQFLPDPRYFGQLLPHRKLAIRGLPPTFTAEDLAVLLKPLRDRVISTTFRPGKIMTDSGDPPRPASAWVVVSCDEAVDDLLDLVHERPLTSGLAQQEPSFLAGTTTTPSARQPTRGVAIVEFALSPLAPLSVEDDAYEEESPATISAAADAPAPLQPPVSAAREAAALAWFADPDVQAFAASLTAHNQATALRHTSLYAASTSDQRSGLIGSAAVLSAVSAARVQDLKEKEKASAKQAQSKRGRRAREVEQAVEEDSNISRARRQLTTISALDQHMMETASNTPVGVGVGFGLGMGVGRVVPLEAMSMPIIDELVSRNNSAANRKKEKEKRDKKEKDKVVVAENNKKGREKAKEPEKGKEKEQEKNKGKTNEPGKTEDSETEKRTRRRVRGRGKDVETKQTS